MKIGWTQEECFQTLVIEIEFWTISLCGGCNDIVMYNYRKFLIAQDMRNMNTKSCTCILGAMQEVINVRQWPQKHQSNFWAKSAWGMTLIAYDFEWDCVIIVIILIKVRNDVYPISTQTVPVLEINRNWVSAVKRPESIVIETWLMIL